jgi:hypothetical protein
VSMIDEAAELPGAVAVDRAHCTKCGMALSGPHPWIGWRQGVGKAAKIEIVPACDTCAPLVEREAAISAHFTSAAYVDDAVEKMRLHLLEINRIVTEAPYPDGERLPVRVGYDWAILCSALRVLSYLAHEFSATGHVDADVRAGGIGGI